jgi:nucleoside-diphosphate-sugar epimerase
MNILITGIHGFVGSNLVAELQEQHTIYGLDLITPEKKGIAKTFRWSDLDKVPPVDAIIHLAGKAHDTDNTASANSYFNINVGLTRQIFHHFQASGANKFIFFSSVKAVADRVTGPVLLEDASPDPQTPYGQSKLEAEQYIKSWKSEDGSWKSEVRSFQSQSPVVESGTDFRLQTSGKKVYILRPCMIHGCGNKGNLNILYALQKKGLPWPLGAFENKRSFCAVDNLKYVIGQLIEKEIEPGVYQVADDEALSTNELIRLMALSRDKKASIWSIPEGIVRLMAKIGDHLHLPLNSERLKKLTESYVVSNQKLKKALGIERMPVSAEEGLKKTLESFKG